ncbi:hypothetical protein VRRI112168_17755 [Vreelandella rituensis]
MRAVCLERGARYRTDAFYQRQVKVGYNDASAFLTQLKKVPDTAFLAEVSSVPLQQCLRHQQTAFKHYFAHRANYPRFSQLISDGLRCFRAFDTSTYVHDRHITGGGRASVENPEFNWVNTLLGNVKNAITATYHAIRGQHAPSYLAEFEYRFNRRYDLKAMIPRFLTVAVKRRRYRIDC